MALLIMEVDGAQIELRAAAEISSDAEMLRCFSNNIDIHRRTAASMLKVEPSKVSKEDRQKAKAVERGM